MHRLGWTLLHSIWILALLGIVTAAAIILLRKKSPQARYVYSYISLILMAVAPLVMFANSPVKEINHPKVAAISSTIEKPVAQPIVSHSPPRETVSTPTNSEPQLPITTTTSTLPIPSSTPSAQEEAQTSWSWAMAAPWTGLIWLVGIVILSIWRAGGWWTARRMQSLGSTPIPDQWMTTVEQLRKIFEVSTPVRVLQSSLVQVPAVFGWLKPTILLPVHVLESLTGAQLRMVLAHELAHIRRNDYLANLVQTCIETLLFFHPAVWWVSRNIRIERENCCDDLAVHYCGQGTELAGALVAVEQGRSEALPNPALAATGGDTEKRVRRLLGIPSGRDRIGLSAFSMLFGVSLLALIGFAIAEPGTAQDQAVKAENAATKKENEVYYQLYDVLMTRYGPKGESYAQNENAPVILPDSRFPYGDKTYKKLNAALDAFAALPQKRIEAFSDLQRAIMQRHLWKLYDMSHPEYWRKSTGEEIATPRSHSSRRAATRPRVASLIHRLALTREQILALPNTLEATMKSSGAPKHHDPKDLFKPYLPTDIFAKDSAWICMGDKDTSEPVPAEVHAQKFGWRSTFTSFISAPGGREETLKCIEKFNRQEDLSSGTQFALIEQAFLISDRGEQILSPLVYSISLRAFVGKGTHHRTGKPIATQSVAEFLLQPRQLIQGNAVMKALTPDDKRYEVGEVECFSGGIEDPFESSSSVYVRPRLSQCRHCHGGDNPTYVKRLGIFTARPQFLKEGSPEAIEKATTARKLDDKTWQTLLEQSKANSAQ